MDFSYDDEQVALREAVRGLLSRTYGDFEQRRRACAEEPGYREKVWTQLAEMGVLGLPFAEEDGGAGAGPVETGIVAHEIGRVLAPEPFGAAVVLAGTAVAEAGAPEQRAEVLGALAAGERVLALAHHDAGEPVRAVDDEDTWLLVGTKEPVLHGAGADQLVVSAALPTGGTGLFLVAADAAGLTRVGYRTPDQGRAARITLDSTPAVPLGDPRTDQSEALETALDAGRLAACHEALGSMAVALATTTSYLKSRQQFGVPLSTFQALTFRAADMYVALELATSITEWATMVFAERGPRAGHDAVARACLQVSRSGRLIGQETIQLHGGIAMTAEYLAGNLTAHLTVLDHLLGDGDHHLRTLAATLEEHQSLDPLAVGAH